MWTQFYLENFHFTVHLFAALVMFAIFWLYFDAWTVRKSKRELVHATGFLLLSFSFICSAGYIESSLLRDPFIPTNILAIILSITRIAGYIAISISLLTDPLQKKPEYSNAVIGSSVATKTMLTLYPILSLITGILYWRKATIGLERHLKKIAWGFFILSLSEVCGIAVQFQNTNNSALYNMVKPFGSIWLVQHIIILIATLVLGKWVFSYLLKRIQTQLFIIFATGILIIFVITTTAFTALMLHNFQSQTESQLQSDAKILEFALQTKQNELHIAARSFAQNPIIQSAIEKKSHQALVQISEKFILDNNISNVLVVSDGSQVLINAQDSEKYGETLSTDQIKKALTGKDFSSFTTRPGILAPTMEIHSYEPVIKDEKPIGVVLLTQIIDNAFLDGIKQTTGFESSLYSNNLLSATTLINSENNRLIGIKENNNTIQKTVLTDNKNYTGSSTINNMTYSSAYIPIKNNDMIPVGMLFVGKPESDTLQAAAKSIETSFLVAIVLIITSFIPAYYTSKSISGQLK